jgi:uncharacterized protein (TIGR02246 family)
MNVTRTIAVAGVSLFLLISLSPARAQDQSNDNDPNVVAIRHVISDYSERLNRHDAHDVASLFSDDADFTNMRGVSHHGRREIEAFFGTLFAGPLKEVYRTDTVKSIRLLSSEIATVDGFWEMRFTRAADGSPNPVRDGLFDYVMTKQNGRWYITVFHESDIVKPKASPAAK